MVNCVCLAFAEGEKKSSFWSSSPGWTGFRPEIILGHNWKSFVQAGCSCCGPVNSLKTLTRVDIAGRAAISWHGLT